MSKRKNNLKLYVWTDFCPDYSGGLAIAIARSETDARHLITEERGYEIYDWGELTIHSLSRRFAVSVSGGS